MDAAIARHHDDEAKATMSPPGRRDAFAERAPWGKPCRIVIDHAIGVDLRAAWTDLAAHAAEPNSFAEPWFVEAGLRHFDDDVRLLQLWDGEGSGARLLGVVPLVVRPHYGRAPLRHVQNWRHPNDFLGTPLVRAGHETHFWTHILDTLDSAGWAPGFLHLNGLVEHGAVHAGLVAAAARSRACDTVHRTVRALLATERTADDYYAGTVRKKKRKDLGRLARRFAELGTVTCATLPEGDDPTPWCDAFLTLEEAGWKGRAGSALASAAATKGFFRDAVAGAAAAGRLEFRRMDLDGRPVAMLVNFICAPGSFSFKTAFDEDYARFSPGVLLQLENLALIERGDIAWMDSCAAQGHSMIDSLWGERRTIVRVSVPLAGVRRGLAFRLARTLENGSAWLRRARIAAKDRTRA